MDYKMLLKQRRSIRDFADQAVNPKDLEAILQETCMAPSASNRQPWRFIIIQDQSLMKKLSDESKKNLIHVIEKNPSSPTKTYEGILRNPSFNVFYNAPCLIMIVGEDDYHHFYQDCSLAAAYMMFAATERNLGTCWIGLGEMIEDPALRKEIGLPEGYKIVAPIIIGYPTKLPSASSRKSPEILKAL